MLKANNKLAVVFFPAFDWAISPTHPERLERLLYTMDQLKEEGIFDLPGINEHKPGIATLEDINRVHFCFPDTASILTDSHLIAAGGTIQAGDLRLSRKVDKSFALVRPPGHHALKTVHGARGFCNINIEAVMIEYLREHYAVKRVAIVDTDCHHGDGTQDIYWHDPDTLFISLHQDGRTLFPGSGFPSEIGGPGAAGKTLNVPLPPGTGDQGFLHLLDELVLPVLEDFKPEIIIHSAGQDNHYSDPITNMNFSAQGYSLLSQRLEADIAVLEGGYSIQGALPYINLGIVLAMAGLDFSHVREPDYDAQAIGQQGQITEYIQKLCPAVRDLYFNPPEHLTNREKQGNYFLQEKNVFYDTANIVEQQREYLLDCQDCRGLLYIQSSASNSGPCLGLEIPSAACSRCAQEGQRQLEKAQKDKEFQKIQMINRKDREYFHLSS